MSLRNIPAFFFFILLHFVMWKLWIYSRVCAAYYFLDCPFHQSTSQRDSCVVSVWWWIFEHFFYTADGCVITYRPVLYREKLMILLIDVAVWKDPHNHYVTCSLHETVQILWLQTECSNPGGFKRINRWICVFTHAFVQQSFRL